MRYLPGVLILAGMAASCAIRPPASPPVTEAGIQSRTGHAVRPPDERADGALPPGVDPADGFTEDEAVATALWSNAQLAADLAGLGLARADLVEAGQFRNPTLQMLFPIGPKPFELTLAYPIEQFWQRPKRVKAAQARWDLVAQGLIQNGLETAHLARSLHAALVQAQDRLALAHEGAAVRARIAGLADARLRAGDISELESRAAANDAAAAADSFARAEHDLTIAHARLRVTLGLAPGTAVTAVSTPPDRTEPASIDRLREQAWSERSDLRAAELAVAAAGARAKWERSRLMALGVMLSTKEVGAYGVRTGPGLSLDLPIFRTNAGTVSKADAEVEQAARQYLALRQRIDLEVSQARAALAQAQGSLVTYHDRIVPAARDLAARTNHAFQAGDVSYLTVLEYTRQAIDAAQKDIDVQAAVRMAAADLDRSVGTRVAKGPQP